MGVVTISILLMNKLRPEERKWLAQHHTAVKWHGRALNPGSQFGLSAHERMFPIEHSRPHLLLSTCLGILISFEILQFHTDIEHEENVELKKAPQTIPSFFSPSSLPSLLPSFLLFLSLSPSLLSSAYVAFLTLLQDIPEAEKLPYLCRRPLGFEGAQNTFVVGSDVD